MFFFALHSWPLFLEHIEKLSLSTTQEVSLASLKSFHEMVVAGEENTDKQDQARYYPPYIRVIIVSDP
jgi:hypothetical protein